MTTWNENEFTGQAKDIAQRHVKTAKSINDLTEKVARDAALNPEQIRTLTRMANVATFQELHTSKTGSDKMIEYQVGDPEEVIRRIIDQPQKPESANIHNDKMASYNDDAIPDQMRLRRMGPSPEPVTEKVAAERVRPTDPMKNVKLAENLAIQSRGHEMAWFDQMAKVAATLRPIGTDFEKFAHDCFATYGAEVLPEIAHARSLLRLPEREYDVQKIAEYTVVRDDKHLAPVKIAMETRAQYTKFRAAAEAARNGS